MKRTNLCKILTAAAIVGGTLVATNAPADPIDAEVLSNSYFLVQDTATNRCMVVDFKPTPDGVPALAYESRALAERALAEASAYDILDCSNAAMSTDSPGGQTTLPSVTADNSAFEHGDNGSMP